MIKAIPSRTEGSIRQPLDSQRALHRGPGAYAILHQLEEVLI